MNPRYALLAACMAHMEGFYSVKSLAWRNRNPGNIEDRPGHYREYATIQAGWNALVSDIAMNVGKPLRAFLAKYAPPSENDTSLYVQVVSSLSGIGPDEAI